MGKWNPIFVNELNHVYNRYLLTSDTSELCLFLEKAFTGDDEFSVAYACGFIDWFKNKEDVDLRVENRKECILRPLIFPPMYLEPAFIKYVKEYIKTSVPEFRKYGIIIQKIGDAA